MRKAFLDLDQDFDGKLTVEDFAKLIGGSDGTKKYSYENIKLLIKSRTKE